MALYVSRIDLEIDGSVVSDFSAFTDMTKSYHVQVELMNKTGHAQITPRYQFSLDYVIPRDETTEVKFSTISDGTCTIEYENGQRITWGGVYTLDEGDASYDGTAAATKTITFGAESRVVE